MIIHLAEIENDGDEVKVSARIELQKPQHNIPPTLWFKFPSSYKNSITHRSDAFLAGLLPTAMALGEPLEVRGTVSPRLLYGMLEYQRAAQNWHPKLLHPVQIDCVHIEPLAPNSTQGAVATAYSGGVDSSYTLMAHLPQNQPLPDYQVSHAIFLHGFDIPLGSREDYWLAYQSLLQVLQPLGIDLIACRTNLHAFSEGRIPWIQVFGPVLFSTALCLDKLFKRFIIPPSASYQELKPWGSSPAVDHLFSTENLEMVHFGAGLEKIERVKEIAQWEPAHHSLRVCVDEHKRLGVQNCCRCKKCICTLTMLKMTGNLSLFTTFQKPFSYLDILRWAPHYNLPSGYAPQILRYALQNKQFVVVPFMLVVYLVGILRHLLIRLLPKKIFLRIKRAFYPLEKNTFTFNNIPQEEG